jgi:hypothetical protein
MSEAFENFKKHIEETHSLLHNKTYDDLCLKQALDNVLLIRPTGEKTEEAFIKFLNEWESFGEELKPFEALEGYMILIDLLDEKFNIVPFLRELRESLN